MFLDDHLISSPLTLGRHQREHAMLSTPASSNSSLILDERAERPLIAMLTITYRKALMKRTLKQLQEYGIHLVVTFLFPYSRMVQKHQGRTSNADPMLAIP